MQPLLALTTAEYAVPTVPLGREVVVIATVAKHRVPSSSRRRENKQVFTTLCCRAYANSRQSQRFADSCCVLANCNQNRQHPPKNTEVSALPIRLLIVVRPQAGLRTHRAHRLMPTQNWAGVRKRIHSLFRCDSSPLLALCYSPQCCRYKAQCLLDPKSVQKLSF